MKIMNARELFKAGKLQAAVDAQLHEVKRHAADQAKRMFLFELLVFAGDLDRARRQIDAVTYGELERDSVILGYRKLLDAEQDRRKLFREGKKPQFLGPPPDHVQWRLDAINCLRGGHQNEAKELLDRANAAAPSLPGALNGTPFESMRDADDLFASVLEVMAKGIYSWVPFEQIDSLALNPPKAPRDLIWFQARLQLRDGQSGEVYLPALYPASNEHPDEQVKLGRMTDWKAAEGGPVLGVGLRTFVADGQPVALLDWRQLEFQIA
jgi:type VI secretion system protein ImpE